jgi:hypothetical protein
MLVAPDSRRMVMARLRRLAMIAGRWRCAPGSGLRRVEAVFDAPVAADDGGELGVAGLGDGQQGDRVAGFA